MKKWIGICIGVALLLTLIITCPSDERHREAIKGVCAESLQRSDNFLLSMLGGYMLDSVAKEMVFSKNCFIFSLGKVRYGEESRVASIGILGHVFVLFNQDDLDSFLENL